MTDKNSTGIHFVENGPVDLAQLNALYHLIGWDDLQRRTEADTATALRLSHYYIAAQTGAGQLIGFARVCGDPYVAQVLDVITHPDYRRRKIASRCLAGVVDYLNRSAYISVTLTDGSGLTDFYQRFGFQLVDPASPTRVWRRGTATIPTQTDHPHLSLSTATDFPSTRPKIIGILGGISHESTIAYYDRILKKYHGLKHDYYYPRIVIHSLDFQTFTDLEDRGDRLGYIREIMSGVRSLERAGVDFIVMAANSPHSVFDEIAAQAVVPLISIVQETVRYAQAHHLTRLLLLGIKYTMQADFYQRACQAAGITVRTPSETEQDQINTIIFDELVLGIFKPASKAALLNIIESYEVDGVILGCTELPLIINQPDLAIPVIDTLDLHAEAAISYALKEGL